MEAVDAGDDDARSSTLRRPRLRRLVHRFGEAGYATPTWPAEYGAGLSLARAGQVVNEVLQPVPGAAPRSTSSGSAWAAPPSSVGHGGPEAAPPARIATNEEIWCQLFSEPGAGSDVAGLSTRAVRDGDEWVVNGQKVWTTLAHLAKWGMLLARTNPDGAEAPGLTYFIVDMHAPGVEVRPLVRSPATPSSTRCSSTTSAFPTRCASGRRATAGGSRSPR